MATVILFSNRPSRQAQPVTILTQGWAVRPQQF
jgi:hypothetical protein